MEVTTCKQELALFQKLKTLNVPRQCRWLLLLLGTFFINTLSFSQTAENPQQGSNGSADDPHAVTFQNGNLHSGNAHFLEGHSIPYHLVMTGLTPGNQYILRIGMDALEGGAVAIDYVTSIFNLTPHTFFGHAAETINPLEGTGYTEATFGAGNIKLAPIPAPTHSPQAMGISDFFGGGTWVNLDAAKKNLLVYGASAVGTLTYEASAFNPALIGTNTTAPIYINIPFTASGTIAVVAWGGHIASQLDYGLETTAATEIQGAPYHSRRSGFFDGTGTIIYANEGADRSVQIDAIVVCVVTPGVIGGTQSVCSGGDPSVLTNVTAGTATGALTYQWQSNTTGCGGTFVDIVGATSATYDPPAGATVTTYYRRVTFSDGECSDFSNCVTVTVTPNPGAPTVTGGSRCGPGVVALSAGGCAGTLTWYNASSGGSVVNTGTTFSPNVASTTSYWVSCTVSGCESARTQVTATVVAIPGAPTVTGGSRCGPGIVALSAGGCAGTLTWYDASSGGSVVNTGTSFSPNVAVTTSYWVSCTVNGCESARTQVTATVVPIPAAPTVQGGGRCGPGIVALSAGGCAGTLTWYNASSGGSVVNTGTSFSPNVASTTSYWVSCTVNGCESARTQVTATVVGIPSAPTVTGGSRCGPGVVALSAGGCAGTLTWYDASSGGNVVNTGTTFSPNVASTTSYWVSCTLTGCESARTQVTATVVAIPGAPTVTGGSRCGPGVVALSAGGCAGTLTWYNASSGGSVVNTGTTFSPNVASTTSYWVSCTVNGCESARTQVTATVTAIPAAPTVTSGQRCGPGVVALSAGGCAGTLTWYNASSGGSVVNTGTTFSPNVASTTSYWVSCTVAGCESARTQVTATVNPNPVLIITNPIEICLPLTVDLTAPAVTAGSTLLGGTITFWQDAAATIPLANPAAVAASGTFYIKVTTAAGCFDIEPVTVSIVACGEQICTYTQGAYGSDGGQMCNGEPADPGPNQFNTFETITNAINSYPGDILTIGMPGHSVWANSSQLHVEAIIEVLPGGGASKELLAADYPINGLPASYLKNGNLNNTLLAQTLTLGLNLGIGTNLGAFQLQAGVLVTADAVECGSNTKLTRECVYNPLAPFNLVEVINDYYYTTIPANVVNAIPGTPNTVAGLFELANRALANADGVLGSENGVSLTAIANVVDAINNAFDECKLFVGWDIPRCPLTDPTALLTVAGRTTSASGQEVAELKVTAYPNPFKTNVKFVVDVPSAGQASLELFNTTGQKLASVYRGYLPKGKGQIFEYNATNIVTGTVFYVLNVNGKQITGKLLSIQR